MFTLRDTQLDPEQLAFCVVVLRVNHFYWAFNLLMSALFLRVIGSISCIPGVKFDKVRLNPNFWVVALLTPGSKAEPLSSIQVGVYCSRPRFGSDPHLLIFKS